MRLLWKPLFERSSARISIPSHITHICSRPPSSRTRARVLHQRFEQRLPRHSGEPSRDAARPSFFFFLENYTHKMTYSYLAETKNKAGMHRGEPEFLFY